jgi:hypothetical protein
VDLLRDAAKRLGGRFLHATVEPQRHAETILHELLAASESTTRPEDSERMVERYRWFLIPALLLAALGGWRWPRRATALAVILLAVQPTAAQEADATTEFRQALQRLERGEHSQAARAFERLAGRPDDLGRRARWGRANSRAEIARRIADSNDRRRTLLAALTAFRALEREAVSASEAADLAHNVRVVKSWLATEPPERDKRPQPTDRSDGERSDDRPPTVGDKTRDDGEPKTMQLSMQPGPTQTPEPGMRTADPGKLTKAAAEKLLEDVRHRAMPSLRPTQRRTSNDY